METINPDDIAQKYGLEYFVGEWHGANPFEAGATDDGFILFHEGNAYDRKLNRSYNRSEVARLSGISNKLYVPLVETGIKNLVAKTPTKKPMDYKGWTETSYYYQKNHAPYAKIVRMDPPVGLTKDNGKPYRKTFSQQTWSNDGYWKRKAPTVPILYEYDRVMRSDVVIVVEGEKAADRLNKALLDARLIAEPYVATTAPGGSATMDTWDNLGNEVAMSSFVILPDNDAVGLKYAKKVQRKLREIPVRSAEIVILPGLPEKGDVVEYLDAGNTLEDLLNLIGE